MGAGIAVLFKKKFGGLQELLNQREFWKQLNFYALEHLLTCYTLIIKQDIHVKRTFLTTEYI